MGNEKMNKSNLLILILLLLSLLLVFSYAFAEIHPSTVDDNEWLGEQAFQDTLRSDVKIVGTLTATERRWRSRAIDLNVLKLPPLDPATLTTHQGFQVLDFAADAADSASLIWHIPLQYSDGDSACLHFPVILPGACTIDSLVVFVAEYLQIADGDVFNFTGTATVKDTITFNSTSAYQRERTCMPLVTSTWDKGNSVLIRLYREVDGVEHNYNDVARIFDIHMDYKGPGVSD